MGEQLFVVILIFGALAGVMISLQLITLSEIRDMRKGKKLGIALLGMALCAVSARAQTCKPVTVSYPDPARSDDGHGPGFGLSFDGTVYGSGTTVTKPAPKYGVYGVGAVGAQGWVNVNQAPIGGCLLRSWIWEALYHSEVYDETANKIVYGPTATYPTPVQTCSGTNDGSCPFDLWDNRWQNVPFISGHTYYFYGYMEANVITIPAISDQYTGYIKIVIE